MRAAGYETFGRAPDVLRIKEVETPVPGPGEVRVRIHASGINPYDVKFRAGGYTDRLPSRFFIPHCDGAGIIDAIGDGVDRTRIGERIWIWGAAQGDLSGTAAEFVVLPTMQTPRLPYAFSFREGACLGIPYLTAYQNLFRDGPLEGTTVLISGGGGAVGFLAIQLARQAGARAIATTGSDETAARAAAAGADAILDYRRPDLSNAIRAANDGRGVDRIVEVELGRNLPLVPKILRAGGILSAYGSAADMTPVLDVRSLQGTGVTLHIDSVHRMDRELRRKAIEDLSRLWDAGLRLPPTRTFSLDDIMAAHEAVEAGGCLRRVVIELPGA